MGPGAIDYEPVYAALQLYPVIMRDCDGVYRHICIRRNEAWSGLYKKVGTVQGGSEATSAACAAVTAVAREKIAN